MDHPEVLGPPVDATEITNLANRVIGLAGEPTRTAFTGDGTSLRETASEEYCFDSITVAVTRLEGPGRGDNPDISVHVTTWIDEEGRKLPDGRVLTKETEYYFSFKPTEQHPGRYDLGVEETLRVEPPSEGEQSSFKLRGKIAEVMVAESLQQEPMREPPFLLSKLRRAMSRKEVKAFKKEKEAFDRDLKEAFQGAADGGFERGDHKELSELLAKCSANTRVYKDL